MLLQKYIESRLDMIETSLKEYLGTQSGPNKQLKQAMHYAVFSGGKRWRPLLLLSIYEMLMGMRKNTGLPQALKAATAVELVHNASLVHDDLPIIMNRTERRSQPALHTKFGNATAILTGDALYTLAFEVLGQISPPSKALSCIRILSNSASSFGLIGGQAVALESKHKVMKMNTLHYIDLKKVGSLLEASADMACTLASADDSVHIIMKSFASNLGMAYQMIEDITADYSRSVEDLDFEEQFITPTSRNSYTGLMGFDKTRTEVERLLSEAEDLIKPFPHNEALREFVQMIQERIP
ncbi:MAG TPA: polyprenyl synthetase family protein [Candidatus Syntrophosphaera thermopropionivorans]|nr:polyprenyl synthetase family protein [Candidatus Syntrophosphaera thermopropionivorans]HQC58824.1 polyprenyl synthetase family protein [Candidatus Syntrophosphaera thermopropionivorans]